MIPLALGAGLGWAAAGTPKAQGIRLLDVWVLGPILVYAGSRCVSAGLATALTAAGAATIAYNGRNYLARLERPAGALSTVDNTRS